MQGIIVNYTRPSRDVRKVKIMAVSQDTEIYVNVGVIMDRTQADVDRVKELNAKIQNNTISEEELVEWRNGLKGALNRSDLERIVNKCVYLSNVLGVNLPHSLTVSDFPNIQWFNALRGNINALLQALPQGLIQLTVPLQPLNTYKKWNTIEQILDEIDGRYADAYQYCCDVTTPQDVTTFDLIISDNNLI